MGDSPLHHIDLSLKGQHTTGTAWGTRYPLPFACLKGGKQSHTCSPALSRPLASGLEHGTCHPAVVIVSEGYQSTRIPQGRRPSHHRRGTFAGAAIHWDRPGTPSSRWASHAELLSESWLGRRQDRGGSGHVNRRAERRHWATTDDAWRWPAA